MKKMEQNTLFFVVHNIDFYKLRKNYGNCKSKIKKIIGGRKSRQYLLLAMPQAEQQTNNHPDACTFPMVGCKKRNIYK